MPVPCKLCGKPITWMKTAKGKTTPDNPDGSSHWGTCPGAAKLKAAKASRPEPSEVQESLFDAAPITKEREYPD